MNTSVEAISSVAELNARELSDFCQELFSSFARSDQRRWGEVYVRGLVGLPGRKTIRRISDHVVGWRADQSLQQFVNQSPWKWEPVRASLAQQVLAALRPRAIVVQEAVFPKNGARSVGVAKQFAPSVRRVLNCQLGLAAFLAGDEGSVPVNWRLLLPKSWDEDSERRARARVPHRERHRSRWAQVLDMLDEMVTGWELPVVPVLIDARQERDVEALLHGLDERNLPYLVQVDEDTQIGATTPVSSVGTVPQTVGELVVQARRAGRMTLNWRENLNGRSVNSQFVFAPVHGVNVPTVLTPGRPYRRTRRALAEWTSGRTQPSAVHLTNLAHVRMPDLVGLVRLRRRSEEDLTRLHDESGLGHFEGRSFTGWHHNVTLVSVAHAYRKLRELGELWLPDAWARPYS